MSFGVDLLRLPLPLLLLPLLLPLRLRLPSRLCERLRLRCFRSAAPCFSSSSFSFKEMALQAAGLSPPKSLPSNSLTSASAAATVSASATHHRAFELRRPKKDAFVTSPTLAYFLNQP